MPIILFAYFFFVLIACSNSKQETPNSSIENRLAIPLDFAQNFTVEQQGNYTILSIKSAWKGAQDQFQYVLYPKAEAAPTNFPNAIKVAVPVERILCTSTVDVAFLDFLDATDKIVAISNGDFVYHEGIQNRLKSGDLLDVGANNALDYEKALMTNPDIALVYSIGDKELYSKFQELAIAPVLLADFMETNPLGRAEWAVFVAYFLGKEAVAIQKFKKIAAEYEALKLQAADYSSQPTVLTGAVYKGTWHIAGGKSLMATLIKDAAAQYLWADNQELSGVPLDFEAVYNKGLNADFWINMSHFSSKKALQESESKYHLFKAFEENRLYNYYKRATKNGGSDIFESAIVNPHLLLKDMIQIFHQPTVSKDSLYYYAPLD